MCGQLYEKVIEYKNKSNYTVTFIKQFDLNELDSHQKAAADAALIISAL